MESYHPIVPALPGCVSEGETRDEALLNIREAIELYLDAGDVEPAQAGALVEEIAV